jgi:hypothetical protein
LKTSVARRQRGGEAPAGETDSTRPLTTVTAHPIGNEKGLPVPSIMRARGRFSPLSVSSGILVSVGAVLLLNALVGAVLISSGVLNNGLSPRSMPFGVGAVMAFALVHFLACFWGGYTAGRMARGRGFSHGLGVAAGALALMVVLGLTALELVGSPGDLAARFGEGVFPLGRPIDEAATAAGLVLIAAILAGGVMGGSRGAGWHARLEDAQLPEVLR